MTKPRGSSHDREANIPRRQEKNRDPDRANSPKGGKSELHLDLLTGIFSETPISSSFFLSRSHLLRRLYQLALALALAIYSSSILILSVNNQPALALFPPISQSRPPLPRANTACLSQPIHHKIFPVHLPALSLSLLLAPNESHQDCRSGAKPSHHRQQQHQHHHPPAETDPLVRQDHAQGPPHRRHPPALEAGLKMNNSNNNNNRPPAGRGDDVTTAPRVKVKTEPPSSPPSPKVKITRSRPSLEVDVKFQHSQKPLPAPPSPLSPGDGAKMPLPSPPSPLSPEVEVKTEPLSDSTPGPSSPKVKIKVEPRSDSEPFTFRPSSPEANIKTEPRSDSEPAAFRSPSPEVKIKVEPSSDSEPFASPPPPPEVKIKVEPRSDSEPLPSPPSSGSTSGPARIDTPDLTMADVKIEPGVTPPAPQASTSAHAPQQSDDPPPYQESITADAQQPPGPGPPGDHGQVHVNNPHWLPHDDRTIAALAPFYITLPPRGFWHMAHGNRIRIDHDRWAIPNAPATSSEVWDLPPEQIVLALTYTNPRPPRLRPNGELATRHVSEDLSVMRGYESCGLCGGILLQLYIFFRLSAFFPWLLFHLDHLQGFNVYL
ncbi:hypothetical protein MAPG_10772 [Magnaporthiopsis poae ATCC 64411]|uniref:Uncharacterized protein n=1 Tax=Magnaporthiopsis poae (strain ATCC 64411 / 73-15) TaxID=644358 RepID=A0A0C4EDH3_MAGP6|nr:hypothetical protein MAPG_10772 [Magnaporthiopsis poae ATCC 64411]